MIQIIYCIEDVQSSQRWLGLFYIAATLKQTLGNDHWDPVFTDTSTLPENQGQTKPITPTDRYPLSLHVVNSDLKPSHRIRSSHRIKPSRIHVLHGRLLQHASHPGSMQSINAVPRAVIMSSLGLHPAFFPSCPPR